MAIPNTANACSVQPSTPSAFPLFPNLPIEIRCHIWLQAAQYRPRVIQLSYDAEVSTWSACKDSCGGLPSIVHVSREARKEALKPYDYAFGAYIDLLNDIIFISDPCFTLRYPRKQFFSIEDIGRMKNIAFGNEVWTGLEEMYAQFEELVESPGMILGRFEGMKVFTLVLSEDFSVESFEDEEDDENEWENSDLEDDFDGVEDDEEVEEYQGEEDQPESSTAVTNTNGATGNPVNTTSYSNGKALTGAERHQLENSLREARLRVAEERALSRVKRGFFRHVGSIHFKSAIRNPDYWDEWQICLEALEETCQTHKEKCPEWKRPMLSIMTVAYGLKWVGDYDTELHALGDWTDGVVVKGDPDDAEETDSEEEREMAMDDYMEYGDDEGGYFAM